MKLLRWINLLIIILLALGWNMPPRDIYISLYEETVTRYFAIGLGIPLLIANSNKFSQREHLIILITSYVQPVSVFLMLLFLINRAKRAKKKLEIILQTSPINHAKRQLNQAASMLERQLISQEEYDNLRAEEVEKVLLYSALFNAVDFNRNKSWPRCKQQILDEIVELGVMKDEDLISTNEYELISAPMRKLAIGNNP